MSARKFEPIAKVVHAVTNLQSLGNLRANHRKKEERSKIQLFSPHNAVETQLLTMKIFSFKNDDLP